MTREIIETMKSNQQCEDKMEEGAAKEAAAKDVSRVRARQRSRGVI